MIGGKDYVKEIQKFTTSQYWNSGLRITAGVMVPLIILVKADWLSAGIPFLWGALFVSLTDTPGPIHHRRNGMVAAILLNSIVVLLTAWTREYQALLIVQIVVGGFFLSMAGIYGARAGSVGLLALVIMLLNLLSIREDQNTFIDSLLIAAGGAWYMMFSLILYRLQPYRPVEQGLGENLIAIANYVRARGAFYKEGADLDKCFHRVMEEQSAVQKIQDQTQDLLFKTRKFVSDASPKSRSMMMIYLDSLDLFEQTMSSYQDYQLLHKTLGHTKLLTGFYGLALQLAAELEHIGLSVQTGVPVKRDVDLTMRLAEIQNLILQHKQKNTDQSTRTSLLALEKTLANIQDISNRMNKLVLYTRMELDNSSPAELAQQITNLAATQPISLKLLRENLTLKSNVFRHAIRITVAMIIAYTVSVIISLSHTYWVLLTIVTIMKPAYTITRKRNVARVAGTMVGILLVSIVLYLISNKSVLLSVMIFSMLMGYSLLRVNYFGFVVFLTIFVIISFHFLDPFEFKTLIRERLIDTVIGSAIAFLASRFVFPVWSHEEIDTSMQKMLETNRKYFSRAWIALKNNNSETIEYESARQNAVVALTNLSDNFQRLLSEPQQRNESTAIHQFVIANHMLTGHIAALSKEKISPGMGSLAELETIAKSIEGQLQGAEEHLAKEKTKPFSAPEQLTSLSDQTLSHLAMILALAKDIRKVTSKL